MDQVRLALSQSEGAMLKRQKIRKFLGRARDFIIAYQLLHNEIADSSSKHGHLPSKVNTLTMRDIEKMRKHYRSHRGVERSDTTWCAATALTMLNAPIVKQKEDANNLGKM